MLPYIPSYPKVWALGHPSIKELFSGEVVVQEKIDGSQISFAILEDTLVIRSKNTVLFPAVLPNKSFEAAVDAIRERQSLLTPGWVYRGEFLSCPKHNTLEYKQVPRNHIAIFDIEKGPQDFLAPYPLLYESNRVGFESVRYFGTWKDGIRQENIDTLMGSESALGGPQVEGLVFKNYGRFGLDGKFLAGKHVSPAFREQHRVQWKVSNPTKADVIDQIVTSLRTEARWAKTLQHLRDDNTLEGSVRDIDPALKALQRDIETECKDQICDALWQWSRGRIIRGTCRGFVEWYKQQLAQNIITFPEPELRSA